MHFPVFDLHCDTADRLAWQTLPAALRAKTGQDFYGPGDDREPGRIRELATNRGHLSLERIGDVPWTQCFACFIPDELSPAESVGFYNHVTGYLNRQIEANADRVAVAALSAPSSDASLTVVHTIENARLFAADPNLVGAVAREGVAMASLSWNAEGPLASGVDASNRGFTALGLEVLHRMEETGVVIDVSHLNDACFDDVLRAATRPFVASHSNSRKVCGHPRNLTDAQFCEIRDRGGIVGLNFADFFVRDDGGYAPDQVQSSFDDLSRHLEHWLNLDGENVVALGSDFDGCDTVPCIATAADMPAFQARLTARFGEDITRKLCVENAQTFFSSVYPKSS